MPDDPQKADNLSGAAWWRANQARFRNSKSVDDLAPAFRSCVRDFLTALKVAGAMVDVSATLRSPIRGYLMRYSWDVAKGLVAPDKVPAQPGCTIDWVHPTAAESVAAAAEMVSLFGVVFRPSLTSRHFEGFAIDMTITWGITLSIKDKKGVAKTIGAPRSGSTNTDLHTVGASYGVVKLLSDPPHWSSDGH